MTKKEIKEFADDLAENVNVYIQELIAEELPDDLVPTTSDENEDRYNYFEREFQKALIKKLGG
jgi:hypothetical protein